MGTLTQERVNEFCPKTAEFEDMLRQIADETPRDGRSPQQWGMDVHRGVEQEIKRAYGPRGRLVRAENSLRNGRDATRGEIGTSRLDILHRVEGTDTVCAYDIKTGQAGLNTAQAARIYQEALQFGIEVGIAHPRVLVTEQRQAP
ncbi:hypothetical protein KTR66_07320 [Roseococcus sp. SDR]|uniref:hypothetical protein n=1 Tax=Roseococcus sp. SDR TaxID=2835532 RepID=UPI001BCDD51E|nr:hypothetical protein [Roseococcus sp. SDR]MBS7789797.1 hypothetical protein [Roseococcus sp. SDR]MBV1845111.1 hypothetical protein [Roseococcus sp. SDR]